MAAENYKEYLEKFDEVFQDIKDCACSVRVKCLAHSVPFISKSAAKQFLVECLEARDKEIVKELDRLDKICSSFREAPRAGALAYSANIRAKLNHPQNTNT